MYFVVFESENYRKYYQFENRASFNNQYQQSWGRIVDEGISKEEALKLCGADEEVIQSLSRSPRYIVIFEYTAQAGGYYRFRYSRNFRHPFEVDHLLLTGSEIIVDEVLDENTAKYFLSKVPPICRYMAAVENAFEGTPDYIPESLEMHLHNAIRAVEIDRRYLWDRLSYLPSADADLIAHYQKMAGEKTAKAMVMYNIMKLYNFDENEFPSTFSDESIVSSLVNTCRKSLRHYPIK